MSHIHWVPRQNKLETPKEKDEVNKHEVREGDVKTRDPDAISALPTPKPIRKAEALARSPPTIALCRAEDAALKNMSVGAMKD